MRKKIISLTLALVLSAGLTMTASAAQTFTDVTEKDYFYQPVLWAVGEEITNGTTETTFVPCAPCTRGQIITFLWRAAGSPEPTIANPFSDIDTAQYYGKAAVWAYEMGMEEGDRFSPGAPCTRAMAVAFMWKYAGSPASDTVTGFTDVAADASYQQAVAWALEEQVTNGTSDTTFSPSTVCTRGQIVTFLWRAFAE